MNTQARLPDVALFSSTIPRLPRELESEIFALAFHNDKNGRTTLLRVAKRVSTWLTPLLYRVVTISPGYPFPPLSSFKRHGQHVRHLFGMLSSTPFPIPERDLLTSCSKISDLTLWLNTKLTSDVLLTLPIRRLGIIHFHSLNFLRKGLDSHPRKDELKRWCSNITHLTLGEYLIPSVARYLIHFPGLKYLRISEFNYKDFFVEALKYAPPQLKVFVRLLGDITDLAPYVTKVVEDAGFGVDDIRIVTMSGYLVADWLRGTERLPDMWDIAEREVERRRKAGST